MADVEDQSSPAIPRTGDSPKSTPSPTHSPHSAHSRSSPDTTMTTPEHSPEGDDDDDDIWDTSSDHDHEHISQTGQEPISTTQTQPSTDALSLHDSSQRVPRREVILSDVPSLRRQHMTDGYREGLSVGKARVMQAGFDAGYPLGVEVGLRVGTVLGVLEGVVSALMAAKARHRASGGMMEGASSSATGTTTTISTTSTSLSSAGESSRGAIDRDEPATQGGPSSGVKRDDDLSFIQNLHARAQRELKISELLKAMDDEKIASIPPADAAGVGVEVDAGDGVDHVGGEDEKNKQAERPLAAVVPAEIEAVIEKWEQIVLGRLMKEDRIRGKRRKEDATQREEKG